MLEDVPNQQTNGEDHKLPPLGNSDPRFSSTMLEMVENLTQAQLARGVGSLPAGTYQALMQLSPGWIVLRHNDPDHARPASVPAAPHVPAPTSPTKAKDLELAGEVALFREIMHDWGIDDHQASALLGYKEPTFAAELFRGLASIRQRDAEERLQLVITIAIDLEALYRDRDAIRKWLRKPHELLGGATPLAMATEGTSLDMLKLSEYVEYLSGR